MPVSIPSRWDASKIIATVEDTDDLREAVIRLVKRGVNLRNADLYGANLVGARLDGARLDGANLDGANLDGARLDGARLVGANLVRANLDGARLVGANLVRANLVGARLVGANLDGARLVGARLDGARLDGASLDGADLTPIRDDLYALLSQAPAEVPALIAALDAGRVNGSTYADGECGCLVGTLAIASGKNPMDSNECNAVHDLKGCPDRPAERFFLCISRGSTPENNQFAKLARDWAAEWLSGMQSAFAPKEVA